MKHWTEQFFVTKPELWLHFLDRGWKQSGAAAAAILKILRKHGVTKGRFLELACGNGRLCIPIAKKGFDVTGIDIGASYIEDGKRRAARRGVKVRFIHGDIRGFDRLVRGTYDAVLSIWTSIGYYDKATDQRIFKMVARRLRKGGLFLVLNTMSQEYLLNHYCRHMYDETDRYILLHKGNEFDRFHSTNKETWVFYEKRGADLKFVDELELSLRIYSSAEIVEMAEAAGMRFVEAFDNIRDLAPARPDSTINMAFKKVRGKK